MKHIAEREVELPEAIIGKMLALVKDPSVISLGAGQPDFKTNKSLTDYAKKIIETTSSYAPSEGIKELREAIAKKVWKDNRIKADADNVLVTAGSQEALLCGFFSTLDVGEQVILPNPGYLAYIPQIELIDGVPVHVKLEEEDNFELNPDKIREVIDKKRTQVIMLNTPANPTGTVMPKKLLEEIADIAIENDCFIFADEAYEKLVYDRKHVSIGSLNGMEDYVATFQTFSKSHAMCGYRVGYAVGAKDLIGAMSKVHHYTSISASHLSQLVALKALQSGDAYTEKMRLEYKRRRDYIVKRLNDMGLKTVMPQGAFYTFSSIKDYTYNSLNFTTELLKKKKVAVVPGSEFGRYGEGYIRCSYATELSKIKIAMDRLADFLKHYRD
ncbi:MAG TPA: aminotransferase class I/II-fold pyridoxal phosphate-dependent enzyme [Candidatus Nanoarchaeia archaeon]|nr:aminotransferase class I/II-fold pyridoxal phosphate-dependent enzyme [Candidatus Nanoarchaeia archaeon]